MFNILKESLNLPILKSPGGIVCANINGKVEFSSEARTKFYKVPYAPVVTQAKNDFFLKIIPNSNISDEVQTIKVTEKSILFVENGQFVNSDFEIAQITAFEADDLLGTIAMMHLLKVGV